jgi:hypothetical protein
LACNAPVTAEVSDPQQDDGFVETSVVETMTALEGQEEQNNQDQVQDPPTSTLSPTPEFTETPTLTPTVTLTPTPEIAMIYASSNTNCRTGPGVVYDWLVTMQEGDTSEAVAVDPTGDYWYIRRPGQPTEYCWLWGKYATPSGPFDSLPVYTPQPTPTLGFDYKATFYANVGDCGWFWVLQYRIDNTGGFTLESWKTNPTDHTGGSNPDPAEDDTFYDVTGCAAAGTQVDLTPGEAFYVLAIFANDPTGHDITTKIKICTEDGLGGECLTKSIRHTP